MHPPGAGPLGVRACPRYCLGGPATGFPASGSGMTLCPLSYA